MTRFSKFGLDASSVLEALSRSQAIIEFDLSGNILTANENFCKAVGYRREDIIGRHHSLFVLPEEASSPAYKAFGQSFRVVSTIRASIAAGQRAERKSGSRRPTTRFFVSESHTRL